jgi:hypothetical protein
VAAPEDADHSNAQDKQRHVSERGEESVDPVRDLVPGDNHQGDGESECGIDKGFKTCRLHSSQSEAVLTRQRVQIRRQMRRNVFLPICHLRILCVQRVNLEVATFAICWS